MNSDQPQGQAFFRKIGSGSLPYLTEPPNRFSQASNLTKRDAKSVPHCSVKELSTKPPKGVFLLVLLKSGRKRVW